MNSFETDMRRAILSRGFAAGVLLEIFILFTAGSDSDLFRMTVPVLCTLPYSTAWLADYQSGFLSKPICLGAELRRIFSERFWPVASAAAERNFWEAGYMFV